MYKILYYICYINLIERNKMMFIVNFFIILFYFFFFNCLNFLVKLLKLIFFFFVEFFFTEFLGLGSVLLGIVGRLGKVFGLNFAGGGG